MPGRKLNPGSRFLQKTHIRGYRHTKIVGFYGRRHRDFPHESRFYPDFNSTTAAACPISLVTIDSVTGWSFTDGAHREIDGRIIGRMDTQTSDIEANLMITLCQINISPTPDFSFIIILLSLRRRGGMCSFRIA